MAWSFLRTLLVIMAVLGLFAQTTARATPMRALANAEAETSTQACSDMGVTAAAQPGSSEHPHLPMKADCIGEMGCGLVVSLAAPSGACVAPVQYERVVYSTTLGQRPGLTIAPELLPPIRPA